MWTWMNQANASATSSNEWDRPGRPRVPVRGQRAAYRRIVDDGWSRMFEAQPVAVRLFGELAQEGLEVLKGESAERLQRLVGLHDLYRFLEDEMPKIIADWRASRGEIP